MSTSSHRLVALVLAFAWLAILAPVAAAQDDEEGRSETDILRDKVEQLEADLAQAKERRNYYQDRTVELKEENAALDEENADLEARIAEQEGQSAPEPEPPATGMTADERAYLLDSREIVGPALITALAAVEITQDPDFAYDPALWVSLVEALRPMHDYWTQIQLLSPPPRLAALHQAYVDWLYNMDQFATLMEIGVTNIDANSINQATVHLDAATEALDRAQRLIDEYEAEADVDISEDLD